MFSFLITNIFLSYSKDKIDKSSRILILDKFENDLSGDKLVIGIAKKICSVMFEIENTSFINFFSKTCMFSMEISFSFLNVH